MRRAFGVATVAEKSVDETEQMHDTFIETQIFTALNKEAIRRTVCAVHHKLTRSLFGLHDDDLSAERGDANWVRDDIARNGKLLNRRNSELQVASTKEIWRDILEFEGLELVIAAFQEFHDSLINAVSVLKINPVRSDVKVILDCSFSTDDVFGVALAEKSFGDGSWSSKTIVENTKFVTHALDVDLLVLTSISNSFADIDCGLNVVFP